RIREPPALVEEGLVEQGIDRECAPAKRRLGAELFQHKLLNRIVEESPASTDAGLARVAGTPRKTDPRSEGLIVGLGQRIGYAGIARHNQAGWKYCPCRATGAAIRASVGSNQGSVNAGIQLAGIDLGLLSRPECLHVLTDVSDGRVEFPPQAVVQCHIWFDFPAVLREQVQAGAAHVFNLRGTLAVSSRKTEQEVGECGIAFGGVDRGLVDKEFAVYVEVERLIEALTANVASELQRVLSNHLADAVRPLERIAHLRQFPLAVIADGESATHLNERKTFVLRTQVGMDSQRVLRRTVREAGNAGREGG